MIESDFIDFRDALSDRISRRGLPFADIRVEEVGHACIVQVIARCTDDPLFDPPPDLEPDADGAMPDGPWNHRQIHVRVAFCESEETGRPVLWTRVTYEVDARYANYSPLPDGCQNTVAVEFNWQFDRETLTPGTAEMRDNGRMHYFSVVPPRHIAAFVEACADEGQYWVG